jgi:hypothetical protein
MQFSLFWLKLREIYWFGSLAWSIAVFSVTICPVGSVPVVSAIVSTKRPTFAPSLAAASVLSKIQTFATSFLPAAVDASIARSKRQTSTQSPAPEAASPPAIGSHSARRRWRTTLRRRRRDVPNLVWYVAQVQVAFSTCRAHQENAVFQFASHHECVPGSELAANWRYACRAYNSCLAVLQGSGGGDLGQANRGGRWYDAFTAFQARNTNDRG